MKKQEIKAKKSHAEVVNKKIDGYSIYDPLKNYKWYDLRTARKWYAKVFQKDTVLLINMELDNGFHVSFLVPSLNKESFQFRGKTYIIDLNLKYFSLTSELYCLDYHESFSLPIKKQIDITRLNKAITDTQSTECITATNPFNLTKFVDSTIIEKIFKGAELENKLNTIMVLSIVALILMVICIVIVGYQAYNIGQLTKVLLAK